MDREARIVTDPAIMVGQPVVRGTRLTVEFVLGLLAEGWTTSRIMRSYPRLKKEDILACVRYAQERVAEGQVARFGDHGRG
jgi:uncharacterized protein (DUF433 family)